MPPNHNKICDLVIPFSKGHVHSFSEVFIYLDKRRAEQGPFRRQPPLRLASRRGD